jgi:chitin synthase
MVHLPSITYPLTNVRRGDTRKVEGDSKGSGSGGAGKEFDSSQVVLKRWAEFERDRRRRGIMDARKSLGMPIPAIANFGGPASSRPASSREPPSTWGLGKMEDSWEDTESGYHRQYI